MTKDEIESDIKTIDAIADILDGCRKKVNTLAECLPDTPQFDLALTIDDAIDFASDARTDLENAEVSDNSDDEGGEA